MYINEIKVNLLSVHIFKELLIVNIPIDDILL